MGALTPPCPQGLSLHEHLERALSSLSASDFIQSLSVRFPLSNLPRFPPGMCFDFPAVSKSSGSAWKVIDPGLCFSVCVHVLQCAGRRHKEQLAVQGLAVMECCWSSFQELGARSDPAGQTLNPTSSRGSWNQPGKGSLDALPVVIKAFWSPKGPKQVGVSGK